jgi:cAMP-dependent protein kinase regulator
MPRAATIQAKSTGLLWALDRQTFRRIVLKSAFRKRKMYEELINCVPMLAQLQNYERLNLADALIPKSFAAGEQIIKQGEFKEKFLYIILKRKITTFPYVMKI